jgi:hypothetical protein
MAVAQPRFIVFAAAALSTCSAAAEPKPSARFDIIAPADVSHEEVVRTDRLFRRTVACLVELVPARARALLDTHIGSDAEDRIVNRFHYLTQRCDRLRNEGRGTVYYATLMRGVIAEIFYHQEFPNGVRGLPRPDAERAATWARPREGAVTRYLEPLHAMARCIVLRHPEAVDAVLATPPMTADEAVALRSVRTDISACLDVTQTFRTNAQSLRALLAEAALKYGEAHRGGLFGAAAPD